MSVSNTKWSTYRYMNPEFRFIVPLPEHQEFYNRVYRNLHTVTLNHLFLGKKDFTFFINAVRRDVENQHKRYGESPEFYYVGCEDQRNYLKKDIPPRSSHTENTDQIDQAWKFLSGRVIKQDQSEVSSSFYQKIQDGTYALRDACKINTLASYFSKPAKKYKDEQKAEKTILEIYFNIEEDVFISLPLIGYGEVDGIVHIIFKKHLLNEIPKYKEGDTHLSETHIKSIILSYLHWYEEIFLDWEYEGEGIEKMSAIRLFINEVITLGDPYFSLATPTKKTEIFEQLDLKDYYEENREGYKKRLKRNERLPGKIYQQYVTNAVTSILIDSYAHNVTAHALSTLSWWYMRRAGRLKEEEALWGPLLGKLRRDPYINPDFIDAFEDQLKYRREKRIEDETIEEDRTEQPDDPVRIEDGKAVIEYPGSLSREFAQLLRFLTEKGAFWSGVTRDANIGGKISSLYSILWYDFIRNPLYLGTIAKTEDILKVRLRIIIYDPEPEGEWRENTTFSHIKTFQPENDFIFAEVNLKEPRPDLADKNQRSPHEEVLSAFVKKGDNFDTIRQKTKEIKLFFPGGVVGRHAFYTMIENEIRNVKHYNTEELKTLQEEGLTVVIGVQACSLHNSLDKEIYRISVWLDTPTRLRDRDSKQHLVKQKWDILKGEIYAKENYAALLGGTYQDKVCACFLFNSNFSQVQRGDRAPLRDKTQDSGRDRRYFPWVRPACSPLHEPEGIHTDYKMSYSNPVEINSEGEEIVQEPEGMPEKGYLKKVFYLWKGDTMLEWADFRSGVVHEGEENRESWDNPSRFSIVHLQAESDDERTAYLNELRRNRGMVRIVEGELPGKNAEERFENAYIKWLGDFYKKEVYALYFAKDGEDAFRLVYDGRAGNFAFCHEPLPPEETAGLVPDELNTLLKEEFRKPEVSKTCNLELAHGGKSENDRNIIHYRNHGILRNYFFKDQSDHEWLTKNRAAMMELFEVFATQVCIFDNRIHQRLRLETDSDKETEEQRAERLAHRDFMRLKLKLTVHKEALPDHRPTPDGVPFWMQHLDKQEQEFIRDCHFLVMHLSLIESILEKGETTTKAPERDTIALFLEKYLLPFVGTRDNFFFVVTTGRGRNQWWSSLDKPEYTERGYGRFTLFRPVESFLAAVENATGIKDNVELKYRIVKTLFGS